MLQRGQSQSYVAPPTSVMFVFMLVIYTSSHPIVPMNIKPAGCNQDTILLAVLLEATR